MIDKGAALELALNNFNDTIKSKTVEQSECINTTFDMQVYYDSILDIKNRLNVKLKNGKCSNFLISQLAKHQSHMGELFIVKENIKDSRTVSIIEFCQTPEILNIIEKLELSLEGKPFSGKGSPLKKYGLYHIHHGTYDTLGASIVFNVKNYWFRNEQLRIDRGHEFEEIYSKYINGTISSIPQAMHQKAIFSKKSTGEWLIYKRHNNINYYLCLAKHKEGDKEIFENKILPCFEEFPELS